MKTLQVFSHCQLRYILRTSQVIRIFKEGSHSCRCLLRKYSSCQRNSSLLVNSEYHRIPDYRSCGKNINYIKINTNIVNFSKMASRSDNPNWRVEEDINDSFQEVSPSKSKKKKKNKRKHEHETSGSNSNIPGLGGSKDKAQRSTSGERKPSYTPGERKPSYTPGERKPSYTSGERNPSYSGNEKFFYFWENKSPFSQWHNSRFKERYRQFYNCEQYMMYKKAELFGDREIAQEIMEAKNPKAIKALGRKVNGFNEDKWHRYRWNIVKEGNRLKFMQNPWLCDALLETEGKILVEASPLDKIWGIGLDETNAKSTLPSKWPGQNLLGRILTELRDELLTAKRQWTPFFGEDFVYSQFYRAQFIVDGYTYSCAEQYMMHQKALLFGDRQTAEYILLETVPLEMKKLGRGVKNFKQDIWEMNCQQIVYNGNYAKFTQNLPLKAKLLETKGTTLVEASPKDNIWGIGFDQWEPHGWFKDTWNGQNLLGNILTRVRDDIISKEMQNHASPKINSSKSTQRETQKDVKPALNMNKDTVPSSTSERKSAQRETKSEAKPDQDTNKDVIPKSSTSENEPTLDTSTTASNRDRSKEGMYTEEDKYLRLLRKKFKKLQNMKEKEEKKEKLEPEQIEMLKKYDEKKKEIEDLQEKINNR